LDEPSISYVCDRPEPLIDMGIAPAKAFELHNGSAGRWEFRSVPGEEKKLPLWAVFSELDWGRFVLRHFTENVERAEHAARAKDAEGFARCVRHIEFRDPEKFRQTLLEAAAPLDLLLFYASGDYERSTAGEAHFWLHTDALQRLMELRGTILSMIENAEVMVEPTPGPRPKRSGPPKLMLIQGGVR